MFKDKSANRQFNIRIRNEEDINKLLKYLEDNDIECFWISSLNKVDKSSIMSYFASCKSYFYLRFYRTPYEFYVVGYTNSLSFNEDMHGTVYTVDSILSESFDEEDMIEIIVTKFNFKHNSIDDFSSKIINIRSWYDIFDELKECNIIDHRSILRNHKGDENRAYLLIEEQGNKYLTNVIIERRRKERKECLNHL